MKSIYLPLLSISVDVLYPDNLLNLSIVEGWSEDQDTIKSKLLKEIPGSPEK